MIITNKMCMFSKERTMFLGNESSVGTTVFSGIVKDAVEYS